MQHTEHIGMSTFESYAKKTMCYNTSCIKLLSNAQNRTEEDSSRPSNRQYTHHDRNFICKWRKSERGDWKSARRDWKSAGGDWKSASVLTDRQTEISLLCSTSMPPAAFGFLGLVYFGRKIIDSRIRSDGRNFLLLSHLTCQSTQTTCLADRQTDRDLPIIRVG